MKSELEDISMQSSLNSVIRMPKVFADHNILHQWDKLIETNKPIPCFTDLRLAPLPVCAVSVFIDKWITDDRGIDALFSKQLTCLNRFAE